jgi:hypothetical protein
MIPLVRLVFPVLETTPQRWVQLAEKLTPELFQRKPAPNDWSAYDCLRHIVDTEFARLRAGSLALLSKVGDGDLSRTARHQELGMVTLGEMIHEWAGHDLMHTVQGERAILQPFIDGCGPWKPYFSDHSVPPSPQEGR